MRTANSKSFLVLFFKKELLPFFSGWGFADTITAFLVAVTALRMLILCFSQPIAGYGNNYDFLRQSSCVGVWENYTDREKTAKYPERPVNALIYDSDRRPSLCMKSSDNLFLWTAGHLAGKHAQVQLRTVGLLKAAMALGLLIFLLMQPISAALRLSLALTAACVFGDFALLLYFNTLYLDTSIFIFSYAAVAFIAVAACRQQPPALKFLAVFMISLAWLGFTRQQYAPFSGFLGLVGAAIYLLRWRSWRYAGGLIAATLVTQLAIHYVAANAGDHTRNIDHANRVDTFLGAVLPAAGNPQAAVAIVGLPPSCAAAVGRDWYSPGFQTENPCPAVYTASRLNLLRLFVAYPATFFHPLVHALSISRPALLPYLGHFERPSDATRIRFRALNATSVSTWVALLPEALYDLMVVVVCTTGPIALAFAMFRSWRRREQGGDDLQAALLLTGLGGSLAFYALFSSVFGDGYGDIEHHTLGMLIGAEFMISSVVLLLAYLRRRKPVL